MSHCRVCGVLEEVGECVICEDCADKQQTVKELIELLEKFGFVLTVERIKKKSEEELKEWRDWQWKKRANGDYRG